MTHKTKESGFKQQLEAVMKNKPLLAIIGTGVAVLGLAIIAGSIPDQAQYGQRGGQHTLATAFMRLFSIALSGATGFGIGWFFSPKALTFRHAVFWMVGGLVLIAALFVSGAIGWGLTTFVSTVVFFVGLGYWLGQFAKNLIAKPTTFGSSEWAAEAELHGNDLLNGVGYILGRFQTEHHSYAIQYDGDRHMLTVAPNRSGKGTTAIITNLLTYEGSAVVIDPKGENAMITAMQRKAMGQDVHIVDPFGITGLETASFNPLDWLGKGDIESPEKAMILADAIIVPSGKNDSFWDEEAKSLLQGLILYVATDDFEKDMRHLGRVRDLMLLDSDELTALFKRMVQSPQHIVHSTGARCLQKEEKLLASVLASLQAQTHFLDSAYICESLSASDFKFEDLKTKPMTIYLVLPSDRLNAFGRWLRLLIQQSLTVNARNIEIRPDKPVLFLLDEMAALGRLTMVEQAFGLMAGYGIQLWGIVQDLSQLKRIYGDGWETFIANAGVIQYFGSRDRMTAEYFSALCGVTTVWNISTAISRVLGHSSGSGGVSSSSSNSITETTDGKQRKLAYPDELMRLHKSKQLLLVENLNPIEAQKRPWFEDENLKTLGVNLHD